MNSLPQMFRIRQEVATTQLEDIRGAVVSKIAELGLNKKTIRGKTVAVACGSRGIADYNAIVSSTIRSLQDLGLEVFIVPAMGSHGGATAPGQKQILSNQGISGRKVGVPIRSSLRVVCIGKTEDNIPVYVDKFALEADYIVPINRIASHTDFSSEIESGLMKMIAIGLGNQIGAETYHRAFFNYGYFRIITTVARKVIQSGRILFGVGILENYHGKVAKIQTLKPFEMEDGEKVLLREAKQLELHLPFKDIDILIIDEMGKDISGTGVSTKVVGRFLTPLLEAEPSTPRVKRIIICDLTKKTKGNAAGVGLADFITKRLADKIDFKVTYMNAITGGGPEHAKIPVTLDNDKTAIRVAKDSIGNRTAEALKIVRIKNTKSLKEMEISTAYEKEISTMDNIDVIRGKRPFMFDENGNLLLFGQH